MYTHRQAVKATIRQTSFIAILPGSRCWQKHPQPLLPSAHPACLFTNPTKPEENTNSKNKTVELSQPLFCHCLRSHGGGNWITYLNWLMQSQVLMKSVLWMAGLHVNKITISSHQLPRLSFKFYYPQKAMWPRNRQVMKNGIVIRLHVNKITVSPPGLSLLLFITQTAHCSLYF